MPTVGPGTSARIICMECSSPVGSTAIINTSTPIPPIQCVNERQNRPPRLRASTLGSMDEPVVVRPEMVSNTAST